MTPQQQRMMLDDSEDSTLTFRTQAEYEEWKAKRGSK